MALYSYKCDKCKSELDETFKMGEAPESIKCSCGSNAVRIITMPSIRIPNAVSEARIGRGQGRK